MDEASNPHQNGGFPSQPITLSAAIRRCLLKVAIKGAEKLMIDGRKRENASAAFAAAPLGNRASPVSTLQSSGSQMLMLVKKQNRWMNPNQNGLCLTLNLLKIPQLLMMKLIAFQFHLLASFLTFPIRVSTRALKRAVLGQSAIKNPVMTLCGAVANRAITDAKKRTRDAGVKLGRAVICCCFVGMVLLAMLVSGFLMGSLILGWVLEPPFQGKVALHFDYTKASPVAFLPLDPSYSGSGTLLGNQGHVVPHNRKMEVTVSLVMPESEYNRNLGMFQVKVELLSASGEVTTSTSRPCMLPFKSHPFRLAESVIKALPLLAGIASESQLVDLTMDDQLLPQTAASMRVLLEQRAEFQSPGAGIPQVYAATLKLNCELPRMKMLLWQWRRVVHVLLGIVLFFAQLAAAVGLVFCRALSVPAGRKASDSMVFGGKKKKKYLE
ncbi:unnamed protein product [Linum tenue]|uniref:Seipin n=1 Tax=Linum tenue TaxID=586396 RepID=A0AAV0JKV4_9ROSI|nr:unnamed protein product [Linum tenue]